jgi:BirA family biotin operon repressor/biotin-[acetyl-CoA-carboxylase] ligase
LQTRRFGKRIFFCSVVNSTNDWAKKLANQGVEEGTVIVAGRQTAGRGRYGREWISPKGGIWFSIILRPQKSVNQCTKLMFVASLAVAKVLHEKYGLRTETKWPNDVLIDGRKICGILVETRSSGRKLIFVIVGIGMNVNVASDTLFPQSIRSTTSSLQDELGRKIRLSTLLRAVLEELERLYDLFIAGDSQSILVEWKKFASFLGQEIVVVDHDRVFCGKACDIDKDGQLVARLENGSTRRFLSGTVSMRTKRRTAEGKKEKSCL